MKPAVRTLPMVLEGLLADGPHPSLGEHADTYGRLIGSWEGDYQDFDRTGQISTGRMEAHFAWVLQGLAVQDLWIAPTRAQRAAHGVAPDQRNTYGSTLRIFHRDIDAWRIVWLNPVKLIRCDLVARRVGADIVQTGFYDDKAIKWQFTNITSESFLWQAFTLEPDGVTWFEQSRFTFSRLRD
jgi:hypothetical protein